MEVTLQTAVERLGAIVGAEHMRVDDETIDRYSRDVSPWRQRCSIVVFPANTQEVQQIVRLANELMLSIWPFSKGKNWGYGATVACHEGAVILMLERMNRVLEVNEDLAYAVIEPGVTQQQLNAHLRENGIKLWTDCTDSTPHGSVLGNALERGVGYTNYGDHFGNLCGMEVVLPDGELLLTGGGPDHLKTRHTYKWGTGPFIDGLFSQSNLGIVTRAGVWLMPEPESFCGFFLDVARGDDVPAVVDAVRRLSLRGTVRSNVHMVNEMLFLTLVRQYPYEELQPGESRLSEEAIAQLREKYCLAPWMMVGALYGNRGQVRAGRAEVRRELGQFGRLTFLDDRRIGKLESLIRFVKQSGSKPIVGPLARFFKNRFVSKAPLEVLEVSRQVYPILKGIPGEFIVRRCEYFKSATAPPEGDVDPVRDDNGSGLIWFAPVVPTTRQHVEEMFAIVKPLFEQFGLDFYHSFIFLNPRSVVMLMPIIFDRSDHDEVNRAERIYDELRKKTAKAGFQQYRTSVADLSTVLSSAKGWSSFSLVKMALDERNVLAPGKYELQKEKPLSVPSGSFRTSH